MTQLIYGIFEDRASAEEAIVDIEHATGHTDGLAAFVHEGHFRDEDVQFSGTTAFATALSAASLVGVAAAVLGAFILAPQLGMNFGLYEFGLVAIAGTIFGVVAGTVAGASESKKSLDAMIQEVEAGRVAVTIDAERGEVVNIMECLQQHGARMVEAA